MYTGIPSALPRVSYYPPIIATLLAAVLLFGITGGIGLLGVFNAISELGRASERGSTFSFGAGLCGIVGIAILAAAAYFLMAVVKGVRDLSGGIYFTRGAVIEGRKIDERKARNWLLVIPSYVGADATSATSVTDEQRAASVDRTQIVQPRFEPPVKRRLFDRTPELRGEIGPAPRQAGYLTPDRISAQKEPSVGERENENSTPHVVFRVDFATRAGFAPDEEVIVAHSRYLQHIFYIARLRNGEWEIHRNKALI